MCEVAKWLGHGVAKWLVLSRPCLSQVPGSVLGLAPWGGGGGGGFGVVPGINGKGKKQPKKILKYILF